MCQILESRALHKATCVVRHSADLYHSRRYPEVSTISYHNSRYKTGRSHETSPNNSHQDTLALYEVIHAIPDRHGDSTLSLHSVHDLVRRFVDRGCSCRSGCQPVPSSRSPRRSSKHAWLRNEGDVEGGDGNIPRWVLTFPRQRVPDNHRAMRTAPGGRTRFGHFPCCMKVSSSAAQGGSKGPKYGNRALSTVGQRSARHNVGTSTSFATFTALKDDGITHASEWKRY